MAPENSDSKCEEDSDSPIRERSKSGSLVCSSTRTRGWSKSVIKAPLRRIVGLLGKPSMCMYCLLSDILTWKQDIAPHCNNPIYMHSIIKSVMMTPTPAGEIQNFG